CSCVCLDLCRAAAPTLIYTLSLHDALPISASGCQRASATRLSSSRGSGPSAKPFMKRATARCSTACWASASMPCNPCSSAVDLRSEEHTSELQSREKLVCRLLLEKKKEESV